MKVERDHNGRPCIKLPLYAPALGGDERVVTQSAALAETDDGGFETEGYLWFGVTHHLSRAQVAELVNHLLEWVQTGSLEIVEKEKEKIMTEEKISYGPEQGPKFRPMLENMPILVQVSPKRWQVVFLSWPITGGTTGFNPRKAEYRCGEVCFGPDTYEKCCDWISENCGGE